MRKKNLVVFDFDGTLASIAPVPKMAKIRARERGELVRLAQESRVLILTGRPAAFVRRQLRGVRGIGVMGLHGNASLRKSAGMRRLEAQAGKAVQSAGGMFVESKPIGFALHYRNSRLDDGAAMEKMSGIFARAKKVARVIEGRKCFEFLPKNAKTKADALKKLVRRNAPRLVVFVGDDQSDCIAVKKCSVHKNFRGAVVKSREVRCSGVRKIARKCIFSFARKAVAGGGTYGKA